MRQSITRVSVCLMVVLAGSFALRASVSAQQGQGQAQGQQGRGGGAPGGRGGGAPAGPAAPDPIPTSAASIVTWPANYLGKTVSIMAGVTRQITPTVFVVAQNHDPARGEVLVITSQLVTAPAKDANVTVVGDALAFDPAAVQAKLRGATLNIPADVVSAFLGKPSIVATAVVDMKMTDLTKRPPAPMTPDDEKLGGIMRQVTPALTALRASATAGDAAAAKARTAELKKFFTDAQAVFTARSIASATRFAADTLRAIDGADQAVAAGKWDDVTAAATTVQGTCTPCHNAHRERQDDGTYRLKIG
jgi:hypothetical protein